MRLRREKEDELGDSDDSDEDDDEDDDEEEEDDDDDDDDDDEGDSDDDEDDAAPQGPSKRKSVEGGEEPGALFFPHDIFALVCRHFAQLSLILGGKERDEMCAAWPLRNSMLVRKHRYDVPCDCV